MTPAEEALAVQSALEGERRACFVGSWRHSNSEKCSALPIWRTNSESGRHERIRCHQHSIMHTSTADRLIEFIPTLERVDRTRITSIASIRRAMARIYQRWLDESGAR